LKNIFVRIVLTLLAGAGFADPAAAQIYSWRDANGVLTLSDRPQNSSAGAVTVRVRESPVKESPVREGVVVGRNPLFEPLIEHHAGLRGIRAALVRALIQVESAFNPRAISPKGAMGLMQLMPATAKEFGVIDPFNPAENIRAGVSYLRRLLDRYNDNEQLALAAYNAGPGAVDKHGHKIPPYRETQSYVQKISTIRGTVQNGPDVRIYKVTELVDGRLVVRYTNTKPTTGHFEVVSR
jgi:soluble lytic murein transglycosylase-like protein